MVGVGEGLLGNAKGFVKGNALFHQQTNELRDGHNGVGVVELYGKRLGKSPDIPAMYLFQTAKHVLQGSAYKKILLF